MSTGQPSSPAVGMSRVSVPAGAPIVPYRAKQSLELPSGFGTPFIDKKDSPDKQLQQHLLSGARSFNLANDEDLRAYNAVWTSVAAGKAKMCEHPSPVYDQAKGAWVAFLRWADIAIRLPE